MYCNIFSGIFQFTSICFRGIISAVSRHLRICKVGTVQYHRFFWCDTWFSIPHTAYTSNALYQHNCDNSVFEVDDRNRLCITRNITFTCVVRRTRYDSRSIVLTCIITFQQRNCVDLHSRCNTCARVCIFYQ